MLMLPLHWDAKYLNLISIDGDWAVYTWDIYSRRLLTNISTILDVEQ